MKLIRITIEDNTRAGVRRGVRDDYVFAMSEGRRQRAATFKAKKGKGSYTRQSKHKEGSRGTW